MNDKKTVGWWKAVLTATLAITSPLWILPFLLVFSCCTVIWGIYQELYETLWEGGDCIGGRRKAPKEEPKEDRHAHTD